MLLINWSEEPSAVSAALWGSVAHVREQHNTKRARECGFHASVATGSSERGKERQPGRVPVSLQNEKPVPLDVEPKALDVDGLGGLDEHHGGGWVGEKRRRG
jgi:hypothetical protein